MPQETTHSVFVPGAVESTPSPLSPAAQATVTRPTRLWLVRQPWVGTWTLGLGAVAAALSWLVAQPPLASVTGWNMLVGVFLMGAVTASHVQPLQVGAHTRAQVGSIPAYLIAALLPPPLAAVAAGMAQVAAGLATKRAHESRPSDIATDAGRWMDITLLASAAARAPLGPLHPNPLALIAAAIVMLAGDFATFPLLLTRMANGPSRRIVVTAWKDGVKSEAAQYVIAVLLALVAVEVRWAVLLLAVPPLAVHVVSRPMKRRYVQAWRRLEEVADRVDERNPTTAGHSKRVAEIAKDILRELQVYGAEAEVVVRAARIHDIGKIDVPDHILHRSGALSSQEWATVKLHPETGANVVQRYGRFDREAEIVRHHHERWDGTGYPHRLRGSEVPLGARIVAVAESFDAMTTGRPYQRALEPTAAAAELIAGRGAKWDGAVVDAFVRTLVDEVGDTTPAVHAPTEGDALAPDSATAVRDVAHLQGARRLRSGALTLDRSARRVFLEGRELGLTARAVALLEYLMVHHGDVCGREQMLNEVWGWNHPPSTRAVDLRVAELRRALGESGEAPKYIETRIGEGYRFLGHVDADV